MLVRKTLSAIALGLVIAGSATPSFAQRSDQRSNAARDAAVRDCSMQASKWSNGAYQTQQFIQTAWSSMGSNPDPLLAIPAANFTTHDDGRSWNKIGVHVRKQIACSTATATIALADAALGEIRRRQQPCRCGSARSRLAAQVIANPYLPIQVLEEAY